MVSQEALESRFVIKNDTLFWKNGRGKNKPAGYHQKDGYIFVRFKVHDQLYALHAHRIIFCIYYGYLPNLIDHRDQDTRNNKKENLRPATKKINAINSKIACHNTSGVKGVSWEANRWRTYISDGEKRIHLGRFENIEDAIVARQLAEEKLWHDSR